MVALLLHEFKWSNKCEWAEYTNFKVSSCNLNSDAEGIIYMVILLSLHMQRAHYSSLTCLDVIFNM